MCLSAFNRFLWVKGERRLVEAVGLEGVFFKYCENDLQYLLPPLLCCVYIAAQALYLCI